MNPRYVILDITKLEDIIKFWISRMKHEKNYEAEGAYEKVYRILTYEIPKADVTKDKTAAELIKELEDGDN